MFDSKQEIFTYFTYNVGTCYLFDSAFSFLEFPMQEFGVILVPERGAEASSHVLPEIFAVHGTHEHVHRLYDF